MTKKFRHNAVPLRLKESIRDRQVKRRAQRKYKMLRMMGRGRNR